MYYERSKLDQYLKVKDRVDSQVNNFINVIKSKQTQDKLTLNVKIRANVNGNLFDSILFSGANNANNETKKRKEWFHFSSQEKLHLLIQKFMTIK